LFFNKKFKEKAAALGVAVEWIDIGTWQLPSSLILEKHKEAWNLARENVKKRDAVERSKKVHEKAEITSLINNIVIANFERVATRSTPSYRSKDVSIKEFDKEIQKEWEAIMAENPDLKNEYQSDFKSKFAQRDVIKKDALSVAQEILKAFRKELIAAKSLIENDSRPLEEKLPELAKIEKALYDVSYHTHHWVKKP
jgi:hypothetical protein